MMSPVQWFRNYKSKLKEKLKGECKATQSENIANLLQQSKKVSEKQLSMIIENVPKTGCSKAFWVKMSEILNVEGPCIKNAAKWRTVRIYFKLMLNVYLFIINLTQWFTSYKIRLRKRINKGAQVTLLEEDIKLPKERNS